MDSKVDGKGARAQGFSHRAGEVCRQYANNSSEQNETSEKVQITLLQRLDEVVRAFFNQPKNENWLQKGCNKVYNTIKKISAGGKDKTCMEKVGDYFTRLFEAIGMLFISLYDALPGF